jgi:ectoine hydroxylase-related dioxygenase (phytanoyl-CoA dioxygenase family)
MSNIELNFEKNGVVLLKDVLEQKEMNSIREEYEKLDKDLSRKDIIKDKPIIVFWKHVIGEQKRICTFEEFPTLWNFIANTLTPKIREILPNKIKKLQLLETIIFNKPYEKSNTLHWHQDVAYFPLKPNNQIAVWIPFDIVDKQSGALNYALGSHKEGIKGSTDLHTRKPFDNEDRELIPTNPEDKGYTVECMEMGPTDMVCHNGFTWHYSGPNKKKGFERRGLSVRFIIEDAKFDPRPGQGAAFTKQVDLKAGDSFEGKPFPTF